MNNPQPIRGVLAPVLTPFEEDLKPDAGRLVTHCKWLISQNCGLAVFGTNSEGNSLSVDEKLDLLESLLAADIDASRMMPGTGCCALPDTVRLTEHAVKAGCAGVLMLPPFYYKGVSEEGLYRSFSEVIERVGDPRLRIYLYHIPQVSMIAITPRLIERLLAAYPTVIAGIKDSSGDWANTKNILDAFGGSGFEVFVGSESFLLANMQHGGAGCISAIANIYPSGIDRLYRDWNTADGAILQSQLDNLRPILAQNGMIPSLKAVVAHYTGIPEWKYVRPPLEALTDARVGDLVQRLTSGEFSMQI